MKVIVHTEDKMSAVELKKILDIMRESKCPNESFNATFSERYRAITQVSKKQIHLYFDSKNAAGHSYEITV